MSDWLTPLQRKLLAAGGNETAQILVGIADARIAALEIALKDCVSVMENELKGLAVIQPELRNARALLEGK